MKGPPTSTATESLAFTTFRTDSPPTLAVTLEDIEQATRINPHRARSDSMCQPIKSTGILIASEENPELQKVHWWRDSQDVEAQPTSEDDPESPGMWKCRGVEDENGGQ
jgi:hypothetical protein